MAEEMCREGAVYQPYRACRYAAVAAMIGGIGFSILVGAVCAYASFPPERWMIGVWVALGMLIILCWVAAKRLYERSDRTLMIEEEGLRVINDGYIWHRFIPWETLTCGSRAPGRHGGTCLVLSPSPLSREQLETLLNRRGKWSYYICVKDAVVIDMGKGTSEAASEIEKIIQEKLPAFSCKTVLP